MTDHWTHSHSEILAMYMASKLHDKQMYGDKPYFSHLCDVVDILRSHGASSDDIVAGWLHDSVEDTTLTIEVIHILFGERVARLVDACTGIGKNRKERNQSIYDKVAEYPSAAFIKVADRIANLTAGSAKHKVMYRKEKDDFFTNVAKYVDSDMQMQLSAAYE